MPHQTLSDRLNCSAARYPDFPAIVTPEKSITFKELVCEIIEAREKLTAEGVAKGTRIAIILPNSIEYVVYYYAIWLIGGIMVPISHRARPPRASYILEHSRTQIILTNTETKERLASLVAGLSDCQKVITIEDLAHASGPAATNQQIVARATDEHATAPGEAAIMQFTAGVTGDPKGAVLSCRSISWTCYSIWSAFQVAHTDRVLAYLPFSQMLGQAMCMNVPIAAGATIYIEPGQEIDSLLAAVEKYKITILVGGPEIFERIVAAHPAPEKMAALRLALCSGRTLRRRTGRRFLELYKVRIHEGYGLAEISPLVAGDQPHSAAPEGYIGQCLPGVEIEIRDENDTTLPAGEYGEIVLRGISLMDRYFNDPHATKAAIRNGWLYTGDIGKIDETGHLVYLDKKQDIIRKAGFPVYPAEVEALLRAHPKIRNAAVIGTPDGKYGEEVQAFIVLKDNSFVKKEEIIDFCKNRIEFYKIPKYIKFVKKLPQAGAGKVLKRLLRAQQENAPLEDARGKPPASR